MSVLVNAAPDPEWLGQTIGQAKDSTLLAAVGAGDASEPLRELYRRYGPRVLGLAWRQLGDRDLAEEVVQETFVRLWRHAASFQASRGSVATFLFTITRRLIIDRSRRRALAANSPVPVTRPDDEEMDRVLTRLEVRDALAALPDAHRQVLELSYDRHLQQAEIAEILGIPVGTVKSRTHNALRALRTLLDPDRPASAGAAPAGDGGPPRPVSHLNRDSRRPVFPMGGRRVAA